MAALLFAVDGPHAIFDGELRVRCSLEHDRLDLLDSSRYHGLPLRLRPRYANLSLAERLAKLRAIWQRRNGKSIQIQVRHDAIFDDVLRATQSIDVSALAAAKVKFQFDRGQDAGGVSRHVFTEFGRGLPRVACVSSTGEALHRIRSVLKTWRACFDDDGEAELEVMRQLRAVLNEHSAASAREVAAAARWAPPPADLPAAHPPPTPNGTAADMPPPQAPPASEGGASAADSAASSGGERFASRSAVEDDPDTAPSAAKRPRLDAAAAAASASTSAASAASASAPASASAASASVASSSGTSPHDGGKMPKHATSMPKLFKLTEQGSLAPTGAETLTRRVGEATDEGGAIVPTLNELTLQRYRAIGRVCALALVNGQTLGLPFARYFLRMVLREAPVGLAALQAELQHEDPSFLGRPEFLDTPLGDFGMEQMMTFSRQVSNVGVGAAPLSSNPNAVVTDDDKHVFLLRSLEHQLVRTIEAQAAAFRDGVEDVTGHSCLQLLSASELKELWGGHEIDDTHLAKWQAASRSTPAAQPQARLLWEWLRACSPSKRAMVLQFATGSARLPSEVDWPQWTFHIEKLDRPMVIAPTESNGLSAPAMCAKASTCARTICLPNYEDAAALERGMEYSLMDGGFGMA